MLTFLLVLIALGCALVIGARYHDQVNSKLSNVLYSNDGLPPDFRRWLMTHRGEFATLGAAMAAWADAKYGDKYNNLLN